MHSKSRSYKNTNTQEKAGARKAACFCCGKHYELHIGSLTYMPFHTMKQLTGLQFARKRVKEKVSGLLFFPFSFKKSALEFNKKANFAKQQLALQSSMQGKKNFTAILVQKGGDKWQCNKLTIRHLVIDKRLVLNHLDPTITAMWCLQKNNEMR